MAPPQLAPGRRPQICARACGQPMRRRGLPGTRGAPCHCARVRVPTVPCHRAVPGAVWTPAPRRAERASQSRALASATQDRCDQIAELRGRERLPSMLATSAPWRSMTAVWTSGSSDPSSWKEVHAEQAAHALDVRHGARQEVPRPGGRPSTAGVLRQHLRGDRGPGSNVTVSSTRSLDSRSLNRLCSTPKYWRCESRTAAARSSCR